MSSYKAPSFQERVALAAEAKRKALDKLKARAPLDEAVIAQKREARLAREAAQAAKRAEKQAEKEAKALAEAERKAAAAAAAPQPRPVLTEAERKAARDLRYQARKNRK